MRRKEILSLKPTRPKTEGKVFTVQSLERILIMNYWEDEKLIGRYCLNTKSGEYASYLVQSGAWSQCKLESLCTGNCLGWSGWFIDIPFYRKKDEQLAARMLSLTKENKRDIFWEIHWREGNYLSERRENREKRRKERIQEVMLAVPDLPPEAFSWMPEQTKGSDYLFYRKETDTWFCSLCMKTSTSEEVLKAMGERKVTKIRHNDQVVCPGCKKNLIAKNRGEPKANFSVMFLQKMDEEKSIARHFDVHVTWSGGKHLSLSEAARLILPHKPDAAPKIYYNQRPRENYASCQEEDEEIFDDKKNPANRLMKETFLYPEGIASALANTRYEEWTRVFEAMAKAGLALDYNRMMAASGKGLTGMMEYLLKGRFYRLLKESTRQIVRWSGEYWGVLDSAGHTEKEVFRIEDKQKINRIRQRDGGELLVDWMRWADKNQMQLNDITLDWLEKEQIESRNLAFITDRISPCQAMNYIKKQQTGEYTGMKPWEVINQWKDYLSMCEKEGKDTKDEMLYRPRQLKRRHDEMVEEIRKQQMLEAMERDKEEQKAFAEKMAEKFPGAEENLQRIKEKFTHENETYKIIVPERLIDIVTEGRALHHCAGATERYFERIRDNETYICFLRKKSEPDVPFYTIEVEPGGTIRQHRSMYDEEPGIEEIRGFLREWQKVIKKRMKDTDKQLARESAIKRQKNLDELRRKNNLRVLEGLMEDFMEAAT